MPQLTLFVLLCTAWSCFGASNYEPTSPDPFQEVWRWADVEGLHAYNLTCVSEDDVGNFWFGTQNGIIRFDGENVEEFDFSTDFRSSRTKCILAISSSEVYALSFSNFRVYDGKEWKVLKKGEFGSFAYPSIEKAKNGDIWLGCSEGLFRFRDGQVDRFSDRQISSLVLDLDENIWFSESDSGAVYVCRFRDGELQPEEAWHCFPLGEWQSEQFVHGVLHLGKDGRIWYADDHPGRPLRYYDSDLVEHVMPSLSEYGGKNVFTLISESDDGTLWLADRRVIYYFRDGAWTVVKSGNFKNRKIPFRINIFSVSKAGELMIGGIRSRFYMIDLSDKYWKTYSDLNYFCEDLEGRRWFLHVDGFVVSYDIRMDQWIRYDVGDGLIDLPTSVYSSRDGVVWVSGSHGGVAAVSRLVGDRWILDQFPGLGRAISYLSVFESSQNRMFFGSGDDLLSTAQRRSGLVEYEFDGELYGSFVHSRSSAPKRIVGIGESLEGDLWFGGLNLSQKSGDGFELINPDVADLGNRLWVDYVMNDSKGNIWFNSWGEGIFRLEAGEWTFFSADDGVCSNGVVHLMEDRRDGSIWAATDAGLSRYDGRSWSSLVLVSELQVSREGGTLFQSDDGALWINHSSREWNFRFSERVLERGVGTELEPFQVVMFKPRAEAPDTKITLYEESIYEPANAYVGWSGSDVFSRTPRELLEFSYRINGGEWSVFSNETGMFFTDLSPGRYSLQVRARDTDWNVDPVPAQIAFEVIPMLWKRPWFLSVVATVLVLICLLVYLLIRSRVKHLIEIREFKLWFFAQISHELRTPLSVIIGPIESLLSRASDRKSKEGLGMAHRNAKKMLHLVDQLLDFQKVEIGKMGVNLTSGDVVSFLRDEVANVQLLFDQKGQELVLDFDNEDLYLVLDFDKLQKIFGNLLSNANKYTPENGRIIVSLDVQKREAENVLLSFEIEDNGIGIAGDQIKHIFRPFFRVIEGKKRGKSPGSGIGLALVSDLVELCGGHVEVESPVCEERGRNVGTRFTVRLPAKIAAATSERSLLDPEDVVGEAVGPVEESPVVLIVDDSEDIRAFLRTELEHEYEVRDAENGAVALKLAAKLVRVDLLIIDVMMPVMDGLELCRKIKSDAATSHIPIIMLTAQKSLEHQLEGLEVGADDYLNKPISIPVLKSRIQNILAFRKALHSRFFQEKTVTPSDVSITTLDAQFLEKAVALIENRISDPELTVELLSEELNIQRMTLYRKIKALTGKTPKKFINALRSKRAAQLLEMDNITISEVPEKIGILDQSYFSYWFKKEFNCTPSEYKRRAQAEDV